MSLPLRIFVTSCPLTRTPGPCPAPEGTGSNRGRLPAEQSSLEPLPLAPRCPGNSSFLVAPEDLEEP